MQKKSFGTWVLLFCFVLSLLAFPVSAVTDSAQVGTWKWSYDSSTATLTISGTGKVEGYPPGSTEGYMKYVADIRHLVIDEGITEIGESSFPKSLYYLESIRIADSVETIGMNAFANNFYVTEIHLGKGIKTIGEAAFTTCEKVESLVLSAGLQSIGAEAFSHCGMKELVIPEGIAVIEDGAFRGCSNLTKVYIPAGVTQIKYAAFRDSDKITDVYFGGTEAQWKAIDIDQTMDGKGGSNAALQTATIHYNHTSAWEEETPSTQPTTPAEPVTPTEPVSPTEPVTPTEPSTPTQPENEQNGNVAPTEQTPTQETTDAENQTNAPTENPAADDEKEEPAPFPWVAVCIGAAVLLAAAGVIVWLRTKKKA